jgi:hypothetical protein
MFFFVSVRRRIPCWPKHVADFNFNLQKLSYVYRRNILNTIYANFFYLLTSSLTTLYCSLRIKLQVSKYLMFDLAVFLCDVPNRVLYWIYWIQFLLLGWWHLGVRVHNFILTFLIIPFPPYSVVGLKIFLNFLLGNIDVYITFITVMHWW